MKRRKKLWIVCAALAVVLVACVLALDFRASSYQFLGSATLTHLDIGSGTGMSTAHLTLDEGYWVAETPEAVAARAKKELTVDSGWTWSDRGIGAFTADNSKDGTHLTIDRRDIVLNNQPYARLWISRKATIIDRIRVWRHNR